MIAYENIEVEAKRLARLYGGAKAALAELTRLGWFKDRMNKQERERREDIRGVLVLMEASE